MKKISLALLTSAALLSLGAASSVKAADAYQEQLQRVISGNVDIYGGYAWIKDVGEGGNSQCVDSTEPCSWGLAGGSARVDVPFSEALSLQIDLIADWNFSYPDDPDDMTNIDNTPAGGMLGGGHLNYRSDVYLLGVFGAAGKAYIDDSDSTGHSSGLWAGGIEGQWYMDHITLYAQGGFMDSKESDDSEGLSNVLFVRGEGRYFFSEHSRFMLSAGYANGDNEANDGNFADEVDLVTWGARFDQQVHDWGNDGNMSLFAEYQGLWAEETETEYDCCPSSIITEATDALVDHRFMVGVSFALNQQSLMSTDRSGATLNLPNFSQWYGAAAMMDR
jgi:opacity protein-like surface antigen